MLRSINVLAALIFSVAPASVIADDAAPLAVPAESAAIEAMSLHDACCQLTELKPGHYKMVFVHPHTCCPVEVCFCLPCGCYTLECGKCFGAYKLRFEYPGLFNDVVLKFKKDGTVRVRS